ncbi:hypothetical protein ABEB36_010759 [Hypothenemus hampei]|uniref:THAP-type domain-containing protein n=1 Tax=Hypothenemus hampei TaxID=57062 RepID=A0ABD1ECY6_HYPHA
MNNCKSKTVHYCCLSGRNSRHYQNLSFFRLPRDESRFSKWKSLFPPTSKINQHDADYCYGHFRLCNLHFENQMFSSLQKNRLKRNAIPTIDLLEQLELQETNGDAACYMVTTFYNITKIFITAIKYVPKNIQYRQFVTPSCASAEVQETEEDNSSDICNSTGNYMYIHTGWKILLGNQPRECGDAQGLLPYLLKNHLSPVVYYRTSTSIL